MLKTNINIRTSPIGKNVPKLSELEQIMIFLIIKSLECTQRSNKKSIKIDKLFYMDEIEVSEFK